MELEKILELVNEEDNSDSDFELESSDSSNGYCDSESVSSSDSENSETVELFGRIKVNLWRRQLKMLKQFETTHLKIMDTNLKIYDLIYSILEEQYTTQKEYNRIKMKLDVLINSEGRLKDQWHDVIKHIINCVDYDSK